MMRNAMSPSSFNSMKGSVPIRSSSIWAAFTKSGTVGLLFDIDARTGMLHRLDNEGPHRFPFYLGQHPQLPVNAGRQFDGALHPFHPIAFADSSRHDDAPCSDLF